MYEIAHYRYARRTLDLCSNKLEFNATSQGTSLIYLSEELNFKFDIASDIWLDRVYWEKSSSYILYETSECERQQAFIQLGDFVRLSVKTSRIDYIRVEIPLQIARDALLKTAFHRWPDFKFENMIKLSYPEKPRVLRCYKGPHIEVITRDYSLCYRPGLWNEENINARGRHQSMFHLGKIKMQVICTKQFE